ncbi:hypothetical protein BKA70DRAFT_1232221, partial [Coprinopsis sp. MPI-PUGE-AT-0042]
DRYCEGLRCGRQWRRLKELKRHGFGHTQAVPKEGEMALFCGACPQDGKNLARNWRDEPEQWRHNITLAANGNFTLVHRIQKSNDDVWLKNGEGYLVEHARYMSHVNQAEEFVQPPTCNEHRAVADRSKTSKGCDVTGVGAFACSRHGAFAPSSVVDFQKGERQKNMDYGLQGGLRTTGALMAPRLNLLYDINCQYCVNLCLRFKKTPTLDMPEDLEIVFGIGQFHVHGHQESCYARFSPQFIDGIGKTSGEILEPLWSKLNEAARPTQTMTLAHRFEALDAHIADNNWKKLVNLLTSIPISYEKAAREFHRMADAFDLLNRTASESQRALWQASLDRALRLRSRDVKLIKEMDVLNIALDKSASRAKVQHDLMSSERETNVELGVTSWVSFGFKIQENQLQLKAFIRALPRRDLVTDLQSLEVARRRERLQADIVEFLDAAEKLFPSVNFSDYKCFNPPCTNPAIENDADDDVDLETDSDNPFADPEKDPEDVEIPLPSSFEDLPRSLKGPRRKEIKLRVAQANDALEAVRSEIGHKSYLYRSNIRLAQGKKQKTRGYDAVKVADNAMRHSIRLQAHEDIISHFKPIERTDTKAITAVYQPNTAGQTKVELSWIWTTGAHSAPNDSAYLDELYRVNWLKAKCLADRAREEYTLLKSEMNWVCNFLLYKERICQDWAELRNDCLGHKAYALRQAETWNLLRMEAAEAFKLAQNKADQVLRELEVSDVA